MSIVIYLSHITKGHQVEKIYDLTLTHINLIHADACTRSKGGLSLDIFKTCSSGISFSTHDNQNHQTKEKPGIGLQVPSKQARERRTSVKYGGMRS